LLQGVELEIRGDGTLDYPDEILAELDVVVASLHSGLRQPRDEITARAVKAMQNPYVDVIGHPSGRILGQREESALDMRAVLQTAAETGTALEVNSIPQRLDLDDVQIQHAIEMGIKLAIDSDAHNTEGLDGISYGVATARRGWAERKDVLNTLTLTQLRRTLKRHKAKK
jgi:DNA polymerase (family 10)